jgi:hypothetical protein
MLTLSYVGVQSASDFVQPPFSSFVRRNKTDYVTGRYSKSSLIHLQLIRIEIRKILFTFEYILLKVHMGFRSKRAFRLC